MSVRPSISIVIPTRNRLDSLNRTLAAIAKQTLAPVEILIVDSSDIPLEKGQLSIHSDTIEILHSDASVCLQRNVGIQKSTSGSILLCDDDIEISENYLSELSHLFEQNPTAKIASGLIYEQKNGGWDYAEKQPSALGLLLSYLFRLSVWFDADKAVYPNPISTKIVAYYRKKGNHIARSGWPVVVNYAIPVFNTPIYGLGAALFRSESLKKTGFDTAFYANGIGDNYDLALAINAAITVTHNAKAMHHKETANRVTAAKSYYYRVSALHYILLKYARFSIANVFWLLVSLFGNGILFLAKGEIKKLFYNLLLFFRITFNKNLYRQ